VITVAAENYTGEGIYTIPEASRLTGVDTRTIRRWLLGYDFNSKSGRRSSPPVWEPQLSKRSGITALGFFDLNEVRFVNEFRQHGVSWKSLRRAVDKAKTLLNTSHPFALKKFFTDGKTVFAEVARETGERELLDLVKNQLAFKKVLSPSLYGDLEFSRDEILTRWWPLSKKRSVVIDPQRAFGKPIVSNEGVPTEILFRAYQGSKALNEVAEWYDVTIEAIKDAIAFERGLVA